jgi:hypothetical protein
MKKIALFSLIALLSPLAQADIKVTVCGMQPEQKEMIDLCVNQLHTVTFEDKSLEVTLVEENEQNATIKTIITEKDIDGNVVVYQPNEQVVKYNENFGFGTTCGSHFDITVNKA